MTSAHLRACPSCARHARVSETACPFCGAALDHAFRSSPEPQGPRVRLARAALVAFGALGTSAVAAAAAVGCSSNAGIPAYGGTAIDFSDGGDMSDATSVPHYGLPGIESDAGDAGDAAVVGQDAAYGSPRIDFGDAGTDGGNAALDSSADSGHD